MKKLKSYSITGNFIFPDLIKDRTYKKYIVCLMNDIYVDLYTSLNLVQLIGLLTEKDFNMIYNEYGDKEIISRKHIVKITEVREYEY